MINVLFGGGWPLTLMFVSYISDNSPLFTCVIALKKKKGITLHCRC